MLFLQRKQKQADHDLKQKKKELIEKKGVMQEKTGMQPAAGRIIGLLNVTDKLELTFDEIREMHCISKSATSNALNLLQQLNRLDYITCNGELPKLLLQWEE